MAPSGNGRAASMGCRFVRDDARRRRNGDAGAETEACDFGTIPCRDAVYAAADAFRAEILLYAAPMGRCWRWMAVLVAMAGCGAFREPPVMVAEPVAEDGLPERDLSHPKTLAWTRRYCTKMETRSPTALGLAPERPIVPRVEAILEEHGVPRELSAVPAVESGYKQHARGRHGELGLWQLRPATARRFGVVVTRRRDERAHVDESTRAAARYLAFLYARYGDWALALAGYNAGEGRVDRALAQQPGASFWELAERGALPAISREYVPKILAVIRVNAGPGSCTSVTASTGRRREGASTRATDA
jgi:hypothetical protein